MQSVYTPVRYQMLVAVLHSPNKLLQATRMMCHVHIFWLKSMHVDWQVIDSMCNIQVRAAAAAKETCSHQQDSHVPLQLLVSLP